MSPAFPSKVDVKQIGMRSDEADEALTSSDQESGGRENTLQVCSTSSYSAAFKIWKVCFTWILLIRTPAKTLRRCDKRLSARW